jgi:hypothetical protein
MLPMVCKVRVSNWGESQKNIVVIQEMPAPTGILDKMIIEPTKHMDFYVWPDCTLTISEEAVVANLVKAPG